jgi:hypothetical protein
MFFTVFDWLATSSSTSNIWLSELVSLTCVPRQRAGQHACAAAGAGCGGCQLPVGCPAVQTGCPAVAGVVHTPWTWLLLLLAELGCVLCFTKGAG